MEYIEINKNQYKLYPVTGKVVGSSKRSQTEVSGSGGGGGGGSVYGGYSQTSDVKITSSTSIHDDLFVIDKEGIEHSFQLSGFDIACREGNTLTVILAIKEGDEKGPYIMVYNHSTRKMYYDDVSIVNIHTLKRLVAYVCIIGFILLSGYMLSSAETAINYLSISGFNILGLLSIVFSIWIYIKHIKGFGICRSFKGRSELQELENELRSFSLVD